MVLHLLWVDHAGHLNCVPTRVRGAVTVPLDPDGWHFGKGRHIQSPNCANLFSVIFIIITLQSVQFGSSPSSCTTLLLLAGVVLLLNQLSLQQRQWSVAFLAIFKVQSTLSSLVKKKTKQSLSCWRPARTHNTTALGQSLRIQCTNCTKHVAFLCASPTPGDCIIDAVTGALGIIS
jgi:hypothetical protein